MPLFPAIICGSLVAMLAFGYAGAIHPAFDSFAHFRLHLSGITIFAGLAVTGFSRLKLSGLLTAVAGGMALLATLPYYPVASSHAELTDDLAQPVYRLLHANIRFDNEFPEKVISAIASKKPDVITLNEVSRQWLPYMERIKAAYPHQLICRRNSVIGGVAILSRREFIDEGRCLHDGMFALQDIDLNGTKTTFAALHLHWPWPFQQSRQIDGMIPDLRDIENGKLIIAGDFNAVPWSAAVRRFADAASLEIASGVGPTWIPGSRTRKRAYHVFGLPIDQLLYSDRIALSAKPLLERVGSDHLIVIADFSPSGTDPSE